MPKFVSSTSGQVYAKDKHKEEEDDILASITQRNESNGTKKPAAINKKGTREKPKSSLELFKEELKRLNEDREEQRCKLKNSLSNTPPQLPVPIPLKPDPRCPTALTLQVNLTPKSKDTPSNGSFDTGDPTTTNLYIGNLNPTVTENELCDIFGRFGPLASIKIMWPRTDEERARNRNSGFVAYMSRIDGERALKVCNGMDYKGYDMKLGWGKAVPLPRNPVFIPVELAKILEPPPRSGLPFNAQLHISDVERGYKVQATLPRPVPTELESHISVDASIYAMHTEYKEFLEVLSRSTVYVCTPNDRNQLDRIHKTIEYVIREGPVFESIITAREYSNSEYQFLYDYDTPEHIYYRWKLYSILHGDDPYAWSTNEFRMYAGGPTWRPPPINPFAEGMPLELVSKLTGIDKEILDGTLPMNHRKPTLLAKRNSLGADRMVDTVGGGKLNSFKSKILDELLKNMDPTKTKVGSAMLFCINHSDAAENIITRVTESISSSETTYKRLIGLVFFISDVLHNSSAAVSNASYYREGFKEKLANIFSNLAKYINSIEENHQAERFKKKVVSVLGSWKYYQLYEDEFIIQLSQLLYGEADNKNQLDASLASFPDGPKMAEAASSNQCADDELDGDPIDDSLLAECLETKGLSLRWYMTLELSDDECEQSDEMQSPDDKRTDAGGQSDARCSKSSPENPARERFKVSKWELITQEPECVSPLLGKITPTTLVGDIDSTFKSDKFDCTKVKGEKQ